MNELKIALTAEEMEKLRNIHTATMLQELRKQPGWTVYTEFIADMVARFENQHLNFAIGASRDAYWISGVRLAAVRDFAKILEDQIAQKVDLLNQPLRPPNSQEDEGE